jgi:hypothetical protein
VLTRQELAPRREQITQRLTGLAPERQQIEPQRDTTIQWEHIASNIEHFRTLLGSPVDRWCFEDRQTVIQLWVEKVVVSRDGAVEGHHILPFEEQPVAADQKKKGIPPAFYVLRLQHLDLPPHAPEDESLPQRQALGRHIGHEEGPGRQRQPRGTDLAAFVTGGLPQAPTAGIGDILGHPHSQQP